MMSVQQRQRIEELRRQGFGYGTIAKKLKMKKNTICAYCIRNGLAGVRGTQNPHDMQPTTYVANSKGESRKNKDIVCTVRVTFEPWKPKAG